MARRASSIRCSRVSIRDPTCGGCFSKTTNRHRGKAGPAMRSLLHDVEIDWGWPQLNDEQRAIARRHEALLRSDRKSHTIESAEAALLAAASELSGTLIRARAVDDEHT